MESYFLCCACGSLECSAIDVDLCTTCGRRYCSRHRRKHGCDDGEARSIALPSPEGDFRSTTELTPAGAAVPNVARSGYNYS